MTIPALAPLFRGPLEPFAGRLTLTDVEGSRPGADLLDEAVLAREIDRFALRYGAGTDRRAVASIWSKHHFVTAMPAAIAANLILDLDLPMALADLRVAQDAEGHTGALVLPNAGTPLPPDAGEARFDRLIEGHLEPLIATLAAVTGGAKRVFWSNAGNVFDYIVRETGESGLAAPAAVAHGMAVMAQRRRGGRPNPLFEPVSYPAGGARLRRVCCLRYLAPGVGYCGTCPIAPEGRDADDGD